MKLSRTLDIDLVKKEGGEDLLVLTVTREFVDQMIELMDANGIIVEAEDHNRSLNLKITMTANG